MRHAASGGRRSFYDLAYCFVFALCPELCALCFSSCGGRRSSYDLASCVVFFDKNSEFLKAEGYYCSRKPHGKRLARLARPARSREAGLRRFTPQPARPVTAPCVPCPVPQFDLPISIELSSEQDC